MSASLAGRGAVVTGGGRGIGAEIALNVRAPLLLAGAFGSLMAQRGSGSIVNVSSALAGLGMPDNAVYAASKGALDAATRALAAEFGPKGVRVNAIRPAVTRSDMSDAIVSDPETTRAYLETVAIKRYGEPSDIAEAVLFLADAGYITGQVIDVDGGWTTTARSIFSGG